MSTNSIIIQGKLLIKPQEDYKSEVKIDDVMELVNGLSKTRRVTRDLSKIKKELDFPFDDYDINGFYYYPKNDFENFGQTIDESVINFNRPPDNSPSLCLDFEVIKEKENKNGKDINKYYLVWNGEKENNTIEKQKQWINTLILNIFNPVKMYLNGNIIIYDEITKENVNLKIDNNVVFKNNKPIFKPYKIENIIATDFFRNIIKKNQDISLKKKSNLNNNEQQTSNNLDI